MSRLLLDTNYLLDFVVKERPGSDEAARLFRLIVRGEHEGLVAATSLKDLYYLCRKGYSDEEARDWIRIFMQAFTVCPLDRAACWDALGSDEPDFEDGCMRAIAEREHVDFIITRDERAFARSPVKSYSAREFLDLFDADGGEGLEG